jgi:hypothetical protein
MGRTVVVLGFLALAPAALASHPSRLTNIPVNLDGDRALERLVAEENVSFDHQVWYAHVRVVDVCRGRARTHAVTRRWRQLDEARVVQADGRGRREVFALVRRGSDQGEAKVVRLTDRRGACPAPRALFLYATDRATMPKLLVLIAFRVELAELDPARGLEVRLVETFGISGMLSSRERETRYRYVVRDDRYVAYSTTWRTIP